MTFLKALNLNNDGFITLPTLRLTAFLSLMLLPMLSLAQEPISLEFNEIQLREEFSDQNGKWPYLTTMENLYMPDKDEYFMHRRHKTAAYAIIPDWQNNLSAFNILTTLKLGPAETDEQTIGVIFLVQGDGKGALVFEFNRSKQYRIKQLVGAYYKFISGTTEGNGWVKSSLLANKNDYNEIDIRVNLPQVDIYLNGKFLQSFDAMDYRPGNMGLLIGPDTKAKSDYFYVYTTSEARVEAELESKAVEESRSTVEQLTKMRYELEQEKRALRECQLERQKAVTTLEEELGSVRAEIDRMNLQNRQLHEFKDQVLIEVDEDVFLTLAENLKAEILKNQSLESQVQVYKDSLKLTHIKYNKLKLALLDKAIVKAEKEKQLRDQKEAAETKKEIETELMDKKMTAEQEKWEAANPNVKAKIDTTLFKAEPAKEAQPSGETPNSSSEVSGDGTEARPLPVNVRSAQKKQD